MRKQSLSEERIAIAKDPGESAGVGALEHREQLVQPAGPLRPLNQTERQTAPIRVPVGGREVAATLELHGDRRGTQKACGCDLEHERRVGD